VWVTRFRDRPCFRHPVQVIFAQYHLLKKQRHFRSRTSEHGTGSCKMRTCDLLNITLHTEKLQVGLNSMLTSHTIHAFSWNSITRVSLLDWKLHELTNNSIRCNSAIQYAEIHQTLKLIINKSQKYNFWEYFMSTMKMGHTGWSDDDYHQVQTELKLTLKLWSHYVCREYCGRYKASLKYACSFKYSILEEKETRKGMQSERKCGIKNTVDLSQWLNLQPQFSWSFR